MAEQLTALSQGAPGHLSLAAPDKRGRTPLMLAVRMLQETGAEAKPDEARRGWLARCSSATPELRAALEWRGEILLRAIIQTRAGVAELADFELLSRPERPEIVDAFRHALSALAQYQCSGDDVFGQEFQFIAH